MAREGPHPKADWPPRVSLEEYDKNLRSIIRKVQDATPHVKIILCTTTCVDLETQIAVEYGAPPQHAILLYAD